MRFHTFGKHEYIYTQVPRAPDNGRPEGHWEDMPPPVRDAAGPGGVQDPHRFNAVYQGVVGHHPQQLAGVSDSHLSATEPPFNRRLLENRMMNTYSPM